MPGVADLMRERDHVMHGVVEGHVDALLALEARAGAERAGTFAGTRLRLDPAVGEHFAEIGAEFRIGGGKRRIDGGAGFIPGERGFVRRGDLRRFEIEVVQGGRALQLAPLCGGHGAAARCGVDGLQHGIERLAAHRAESKSGVSRKCGRPRRIEAEPCAGDAIQSGGEGDSVISHGFCPA
jgi:hypothetical protein